MRLARASSCSRSRLCSASSAKRDLPELERGLGSELDEEVELLLVEALPRMVPAQDQHAECAVAIEHRSRDQECRRRAAGIAGLRRVDLGRHRQALLQHLRDDPLGERDTSSRVRRPAVRSAQLAVGRTKVNLPLLRGEEIEGPVEDRSQEISPARGAGGEGAVDRAQGLEAARVASQRFSAAKASMEPLLSSRISAAGRMSVTSRTSASPWAARVITSEMGAPSSERRIELPAILIRSPGRTSVGATTGRPFTYVPLREPRSSTRSDSSRRVRRA